MSKEFFTEEPKPPFFYQFLLSSLENQQDIFDTLKNLFFIGICQHFNISFFDLHKIEQLHIDTISKYLLSLGIKVYFKKFDYEELNYLYEECLKDLEHFENVEMIMSVDYRTKLIQKLQLQCNIKDLDNLKEYNKKLDNHFLLNYFEKWYTPTKLHEFYIPIEFICFKEKRKRKCSLIYFDYYKDYSYLSYKH